MKGRETQRQRKIRGHWRVGGQEDVKKARNNKKQMGTERKAQQVPITG